MNVKKSFVNTKMLFTTVIIIVIVALASAIFYTFFVNKTLNTIMPLASYSGNTLETPIDLEVTIHDPEALKELSKVNSKIYANVLNGEIIFDSTLKTISYTDEGSKQPTDFRNGKIHTIGGEDGDGFLSFKPFTSIMSTDEKGETSELKVYDTAEIDQHELTTDSDGNYWFIRYSLNPCESAPEWCGGDQKPDEVVEFASCVITQVDSQGKMLYNWDALDYIPASELRQSKWTEGPVGGFYAVPNSKDQAPVADPYHCNTIDVSEDGKNFLITMRHTDSVYKIQKSNNQVEWKIGGNDWEGKSLKILPEAKYDSQNLISGPHDARFEPGNLISLLDNSTNISRASRGFVLDVNPLNKTANVNLELVDPSNESSNCKGSFRSIANSGYWIAGWGCSPNSATIFDNKGNPVISLSPVQSEKNQETFLKHWGGDQKIADILNQGITYRFSVNPDAKP